jgi:hypothetical protein
MKAMVRISTKMILILLTLMNIVGCNCELIDSGHLRAGYVNNSEASGSVMVDTGQTVCFEYSDGHVTCTCSR